MSPLASRYPDYRYATAVGIAYEDFAAGSCRASFEVTPIPSSAISFLRILFDMLGQN